MNHLNFCFIEGNIVKDPEIRNIEGIQKTVTSFAVAQHRSYTNSRHEAVEDVNFFNVEVWGAGFAEKVAPYLKKGTLARVQGRLKQEVWTDSEEKRHEKYSLIAESVDFQSLPKDRSEIRPDVKNSDVFDVEVIDCSGDFDGSDGQESVREQSEMKSGKVKGRKG